MLDLLLSCNPLIPPPDVAAHSQTDAVRTRAYIHSIISFFSSLTMCPLFFRGVNRTPCCIIAQSRARRFSTLCAAAGVYSTVC